MTDNRLGGIALIVGAVAGIITMGLHPSGRDLLAPGHLSPATALAVTAHALAIASFPVSFLGALALSRRLDAPGRLSVAALVVYGFALVAGMVAATVSGFLGPSIAREVADASAATGDTWRMMFQLSGFLNQAFARIFVVASSMAIVLWSISIVRGRALAPGIGIYGLVIGPVVIFAVGSGHVRLNVHGMGLVVLTQAVWYIVVGTLLSRTEDPGVRPSPAG